LVTNENTYPKIKILSVFIIELLSSIPMHMPRPRELNLIK
jgi:hypothetical protein